MKKITRTQTVTGRIKKGFNPAGVTSKAHKTTPGSPGSNACGVVMKKQASLLLRKVISHG